MDGLKSILIGEESSLDLENQEIFYSMALFLGPRPLRIVELARKHNG